MIKEKETIAKKVARGKIPEIKKSIIKEKNTIAKKVARN